MHGFRYEEFPHVEHLSIDCIDVRRRIGMEPAFFLMKHWITAVLSFFECCRVHFFVLLRCSFFADCCHVIFCVGLLLPCSFSWIEAMLFFLDLLGLLPFSFFIGLLPCSSSRIAALYFPLIFVVLLYLCPTGFV